MYQGYVPLYIQDEANGVADCKFTHPASRPTPKAKTGFGFGNKAGTFGSGMNKSKKFGGGDSKKTLNPSAGSFVPKPAGDGVAS